MERHACDVVSAGDTRLDFATIQVQKFGAINYKQ